LAIEEEAKEHFLSLGYSFEQECLSQFCFLLAAAFFFIYICGRKISRTGILREKKMKKNFRSVLRDIFTVFTLPYPGPYDAVAL
jgi:hypothetical protein